MKDEWEKYRGKRKRDYTWWGWVDGVCTLSASLEVTKERRSEIPWMSDWQDISDWLTMKREDNEGSNTTWGFEKVIRLFQENQFLRPKNLIRRQTLDLYRLAILPAIFSDQIPGSLLNLLLKSAIMPRTLTSASIRSLETSNFPYGGYSQKIIKWLILKILVEIIHIRQVHLPPVKLCCSNRITRICRILSARCRYSTHEQSVELWF